MSRRIDQLTPQQRDRMGSFAQEWIREGLRTEPLTEEEWDVWTAGARRCYEFAGIPFPGTVVRVSSPFVGALAAPIADHLIRRSRSGGAVGDAVGGAVGGAVRDAVDGAVDDAVGGAVRGAVHDAVGGAVRGAVRDAVLSGYYKFFGGRIGGGWTWNGWTAWAAFFRDVAGLDFDTDIWDRASALEAAESAGWWWPFRDFVMVCDTPTTINRERVAPDGWGSHRLHCETGPAIAWSDGWAVHAWHGVRVPAWVIEAPTVERALKEQNSEIRRCAFESLGWDQAIRGLGLTPLATAPDPANAPHQLALYALPTDVYDQPVNLLLMTNGSPDRSGALRRYGETVPSSITDPIAAAAWQYQVEPDIYRQLERRT